MSGMRLLAFYLPQFHAIKENNEWWGEGYTEWNAVRNAKKLFKGHSQPKIPFNHNYYDLSEESGEVWKWQANMAKEFGLDGFCIYHYWFGGKLLLEKPMEVLLLQKEIDIKYCVCWANETWRRTWYDRDPELLIEQTYGGREEITEHYGYLSKFFKDSRYIKVDGKPVINIYRPKDINNFDELLDIWNELALDDGFEGICPIISMNSIENCDTNSKMLYGQYMFEPGYSTKNGMSFIDSIEYYMPILAKRIINKFRNEKMLEQKINGLRVYKRSVRNYKRLSKNTNINTYMGIFPTWDNTPRKGYKGTVYMGLTPETFQKQLQKIQGMVGKEDFVYINAWNEWGEGAYLEPDEVNEYAYLNSIRKVIAKNL